MRGNDYIAIKNRPDTSASFFHSASVYDAALLLTRCITYERLSNRTTRVSARSMPRYKRNKNKATSLRIKVVSASSARELCQSASFPIHSVSRLCALLRNVIARNRAILGGCCRACRARLGRRRDRYLRALNPCSLFWSRISRCVLMPSFICRPYRNRGVDTDGDQTIIFDAKCTTKIRWLARNARRSRNGFINYA